MTRCRLSITGCVSMTVLGGIQIGLLSLLIGCNTAPEPYEIWPETRRELAPLYEKFEQGKYLHTIYIPVLGHPVEVFVVDTVRGAHLGFIRIDKSARQFWILDRDFEVVRYNDSHLFVTIDVKFVHTIQNCGYGPEHPEAFDEDSGRGEESETHWR